MKPGEMNRRRRCKALGRLRSSAHPPYLTTTEALRAIDAGCNAVKFHRILQARGLATARQGPDRGYDFHLPNEFGRGTVSIKNYRLFDWSPKGIEFMGTVLQEEGIAYSIPVELRQWL